MVSRVPNRYEDDIVTTRGPDGERPVRESTQGSFAPPNYAWVGGVALVIVGGILLLHNSGLIPLPENWWTLFMLIPAAVVVGVAWMFYRDAGNRFTSEVGWSLTAAAILVAVASIFLFGLSWGVVWPIFMILAGIGLFISWLAPSGPSTKR